MQLNWTLMLANERFATCNIVATVYPIRHTVDNVEVTSTESVKTTSLTWIAFYVVKLLLLFDVNSTHQEATMFPVISFGCLVCCVSCRLPLRGYLNLRMKHRIKNWNKNQNPKMYSTTNHTLMLFIKFVFLCAFHAKLLILAKQTHQ